MQFVRVHLGFGGPHPTVRLQCSDPTVQVTVDQPVPRWHRGAVVEQWRILDHHGFIADIMHYHAEPTLWWPTQQLCDFRGVTGQSP